MFKRWALAGALSAVVLMSIGSVGAMGAGRSPLNALVRQTKALPHALGTKKQHHALLHAARKARTASRRHACVSLRQLSRYRRIVARIHPGKGKRFGRANAKLELLAPTSLNASRKLLFSKKTRRCGGGKKANTRTKPVTKVLSSDANGMSLQVLLPAVQFGTKTGGGRTWTSISLPNTDSPSAPGKPSIPAISENFGMPDGSTLTVDPGKTSSFTLGGVKLYPEQPDVVDADTPQPNFFAGPFATPPFTQDNKTYKTDSPFPSKAASGDVLGNFRDVKVGALQIPGAQYNPVSQTLKVLTSVKVKITFNGGPHTFNPELGSPWELPQREAISSLINRSVFTKFGPGIFRRCGEEMLVITNPATQAAADSFATARRNAGMRVSVVQVGSASGQIGTTPTDIQSYIRGQLTRLLCIHPSYITIMGDNDLVPTFTDFNGIPSDNKYAMKDDADELPDVAVGRILGTSQDAVQTVVNKIVGYETAPPSGPWIRHATIAADFQDDNTDGQEERTFIWFAETVRRGLLSGGLGMSADRIYGMAPTTTPQKFNDGTPLPASLLQPTFAWNGNATDVSNAWNDGRFLMIHRDHGWSDGWGTPGYGTSDVQALHNGNILPVLLSINCSSAAYDYDKTSFVSESLVNPNGGAVAAFGDTRDSPSWHNSQLGLGIVDALLPRILPSEGPATKQRMGYALINGKLRLNGLSSYTTDGDSHNEMYLWHVFGDPSMQMWGGDPINILDPSVINAVFSRAITIDSGPGDPPPYEVNVTLPAELAGQTISLLRDGQVIGKANVGDDGKATILAAFGDGAPKPGDLRVAMEPDGAEPVQAPVKDVPATTTTVLCPAGPVNTNSPWTLDGTFSPAAAGKNIVVRYTPPDEPAFERTVQTDANGRWSSTITPWDEDPNSRTHGGGTWKVSARFDGDSSEPPSASSECTVTVNDNT